jgi:hypothetical protein
MTVYVLLASSKNDGDLSQKSWTVVKADVTDSQQMQVQTASLKQIQDMVHQGHELWLILSGKFASLYQIELPKMAEKDLLPAIRSIVEDNLPQDFENYHCFYQMQTQKKKQLLDIGLVDRAFFEELVYQWQSHGVSLSGIALDWMALNPEEMLVLESGDALVHVGDLRGYLPSSLWSSRLLGKAKSFQCFYVSDLNFPIPNAQQLGMSYPEWLVKRLRHRGLFNICMPVKTFHFLDRISRVQLERYFLKIGLGMVGLSILSFLGFFIKNSVSYFSNQNQIQSYAAHTGVNLEQKLLTYQSQQNQKNQFWKLFMALQHAIVPGVQLLNLNYEAEHITLMFSATDMKVLQQFKQNLVRAHLFVKESQVMVTDKGINASLELRGRS